ncbi:MAG TPA: CoA transferase [Vineibacter sp.]|nr:CoA transferase [Vineibacter sp.]
MSETAPTAAGASAPATLPLAGLRVLDVASFIAAPAATVVMADFGADVIKVEPPDGDPLRRMRDGAGMPKCAIDYSWELDGRNKRSIALDLKSASGRAVLDRLIACADVLVTNYPLPARARLRLRYADVAPLNARLIYASLSGYGETGPEANQPGYDVSAYFGRSAIVDAMRVADGPPSLTLPAQGDHPTAMTLFGGIMLALYARERTGHGGEVATNLIHNGIWANGIFAQAALLGAFPEPRRGRQFAKNALANVYRARDGRWLSLVIVREERLWAGFCRAMELPHLVDDVRFASRADRARHVPELMGLLDSQFATRDLDDWRVRLAAADITFGALPGLRDLPHDPQLEANGTFVATDDPALPRTIANPLKLAGAPQVPPRRAPSLGQHSDAILREVGYADADIVTLRAAGAVV